MPQATAKLHEIQMWQGMSSQEHIEEKEIEIIFAPDVCTTIDTRQVPKLKEDQRNKETNALLLHIMFIDFKR